MSYFSRTISATAASMTCREYPFLRNWESVPTPPMPPTSTRAVPIRMVRSTTLQRDMDVSASTNSTCQPNSFFSSRSSISNLPRKYSPISIPRRSFTSSPLR